MLADTRRAGDQALLLLGIAVVVACIGLGAPPRMEAVEGAPAWTRQPLEALLPLALVQVLTLLAAARLAVAGAFFGTRGARLVQLPLCGVLGLGVVQLALGATAWTYGTGVALVQVLGLATAGAAVVASTLGRADRDGALIRARRLLVFVAAVAALECGYGVLATRVGGDTILGLAKVSSLGRVTGTFVMPSVLAALGAIGACAALALACLAQRERRSAVALVWFAALAVCCAGVVLSLSRWMLVAAAVGIVATLWLIGGALRRDGRAWAGATLRWTAALVPAAGVAAAFLVPTLRARFEFILPYLHGQSGPVEPRFAGWLSTWDLFVAHPIIGTGLGSFGRAIHLTQSVDAPEELWYAHSEPLNVLSDVGVVGFLLFAIWVGGQLWLGRRAGGAADVSGALLAAGATGGALAVLVAGLGDFPTQFAPVALPLAALLALPVALGWGAATETGLGSDSATDQKRRLVIAGALVAIAALPVIALGARWIHVARGFAPGASAGERLLVVGRAQLNDLQSATTPAEAEAAAASAALTLERAAEAEPFHDAAHLWLGLAHLTVLQLTTDTAEATARKDAALAAFGAARHVSRGHANVNLQIGIFYLDLLGTEPNAYGPPGDTAMAALNEAGALLPQAFARAWEEAVQREVGDDVLAQIVPDRSHAQRRWARHLRAVGRVAEADAILRSLDPESPADR